MRLRGRVKAHGLLSLLPACRGRGRGAAGGAHARAQREGRSGGGGSEGEEDAAEGRGGVVGEADQAGDAEGEVQVQGEVQLRSQRAAQGAGLPAEVGQEKEGVLEQLVRGVAGEAREVQGHVDVEEGDGGGGEQGVHR